MSLFRNSSINQLVKKKIVKFNWNFRSLNVRSDGILLHKISPREFLDSVEWKAKQLDPLCYKFQVSKRSKKNYWNLNEVFLIEIHCCHLFFKVKLPISVKVFLKSFVLKILRVSTKKKNTIWDWIGIGTYFFSFACFKKLFES